MKNKSSWIELNFFYEMKAKKKRIKHAKKREINNNDKI